MVTSLLKRWINEGYKNFRADMLLRRLEEESVSFNNYSFSVRLSDSSTGTMPVLGTACAIYGHETPDIWFKPLRVIINVPCPHLLFIHNFQIGSESWIQGPEDAYDYAPFEPKDSRYVLPLMKPGMPCKIHGQFTNHVPDGFVAGRDFNVVVTLKGIGTMQPDKVFRREAIKKTLIKTDDEDIRPEWRE